MSKGTAKEPQEIDEVAKALDVCFFPPLPFFFCFVLFAHFIQRLSFSILIVVLVHFIFHEFKQFAREIFVKKIITNNEIDKSIISL